MIALDGGEPGHHDAKYHEGAGRILSGLGQRIAAASAKECVRGSAAEGLTDTASFLLRELYQNQETEQQAHQHQYKREETNKKRKHKMGDAKLNR